MASVFAWGVAIAGGVAVGVVAVLAPLLLGTTTVSTEISATGCQEGFVEIDGRLPPANRTVVVPVAAGERFDPVTASGAQGPGMVAAESDDTRFARVRADGTRISPWSNATGLTAFCSAHHDAASFPRAFVVESNGSATISYWAR